MTKATMYWNRMRLEVSGHAGGGTKGNDLICAGISALISALIGSLQEAEQRGRCDMDYDEKDGEARVWADPIMGCSNEIRAYFKMCMKGLRMMEQQYPENVKAEEVH